MEEERFAETIDSGMAILNEYILDIQNKDSNVLSGEKAFRLYDTYGFPLELTEEILEDKNIKIDIDGFNEEMQQQRERARAAREESSYMGVNNGILDKIPSDLNTSFDGYDKLELQSKVELLISNEKFVDELTEGNSGILVTERTPFYSEMGGQIGDKGTIFGEGFEGIVTDCKKNISNKIVHIIKIKKGKVKINEKITLKVDKIRRNNISKNHTATHMLHKALRMVLGEHVHQSGSYVDEERLRFDFTHFTALTQVELKKVEYLVNENIMKTSTVNTKLMTLDEARESGAMALFDNKYGDDVRVVSVGDFSKELCGGTHISNSGEIGLFKIVSEAGVASGIRRIEAVTGLTALKSVDEKVELIKSIEKDLKCSEKDILNKVSILTNEIKEKDKEIGKLKSKLASGSEGDIIKSIKDINGVKLAVAALKDVDANSLRDLADKTRDKIGEGVVVLGSSINGKVQLIAMATKDAVLKGVNCGKIIKEVATICGGGGGGRPDMAQAGGKSPEKLQEAIEKVESIMAKLVK